VYNASTLHWVTADSDIPVSSRARLTLVTSRSVHPPRRHCGARLRPLFKRVKSCCSYWGWARIRKNGEPGIRYQGW